MLKKISDKTKQILYVVSFSLLILIFICLLFFTRDSKKIIEVTDFIKTDTKVLYVSSDNKLNYPNKILKKYEIDYLFVDSSKLSVFEIKKIQKIVDNKDFNNILVIYKSGEIVDSLINYKSEKSINEFLQKNTIIPEEIVDNVEDIMNSANNILNNNYSMIYIPYKNNDEISNQNKIFKGIAEKYNIEYKKIDAYLLSNKQQERINKLLGLSSVEDQILILIKDNKMIANIRGIHSRNTYVESLYDVNFINELENKINEIDYDTFKDELKNQKKSIIMIGSINSKDSNDVHKLLNEMIYNYDINVNYINIEKEESNIYNEVKEELLNIGYNGSFSLPLVVIVESNNILDYAVGNSKEEYFLDIFIENGVIKGDVMNG